MNSEGAREVLEPLPEANGGVASRLSMLNVNKSSRATGVTIEELDAEGKVVAAPEESEAESEEDEGPSLMEEMLEAAEAAREEKAAAQRREEKRMKKGFGGGMRKGFLTGPKKAKGKRKSGGASKTEAGARPPAVARAPAASTEPPAAPVAGRDGVETLAPRPPAPGDKEANPLYMPEVQQAMKAGVGAMEAALEHQEWLTPEFLAKIQQKPRLAAALGNPAFLALLGRMQSDPAAVRQEMSGNKDMTELLQEFMGLLGSHFEELGKEETQRHEEVAQAAKGPLARKILEKEEARREAGAPTSMESLSAGEQQEVHDHLANPEVRALLMDQALQRCIVEASSNAAAFQRAMCDPTLAPKLRRMADLGLLQIQR